MTVLDQIVEKTAQRVAAEKQTCPPKDVQSRALSLPKKTFSFEKALRSQKLVFICEIKKASPSKGVIAPDFPYLAIAKEYEEAGAAAISILTEPDFFMGKNAYLSDIKKVVSVPCLRKDFMIDTYQIYQSRLIGADAVLLICAILDDQQLKEFMEIADTLGMSCLVEAHDEAEIFRALSLGARLIGVNNRNLKNFDVSLETSIRLRRLVPSGVIFVAESGIQSAEDIKLLREAEVDAVLIGETLMRSPNKKAALQRLKGEL